MLKTIPWPKKDFSVSFLLNPIGGFLAPGAGKTLLMTTLKIGNLGFIKKLLKLVMLKC